jgi:hypothetical protein
LVFFLIPLPAAVSADVDEASPDDGADLSLVAAGATAGEDGGEMMLREEEGPTLMRFRKDGFLAFPYDAEFRFFFVADGSSAVDADRLCHALTAERHH